MTMPQQTNEELDQLLLARAVDAQESEHLTWRFKEFKKEMREIAARCGLSRKELRKAALLLQDNRFREMKRWVDSELFLSLIASNHKGPIEVRTMARY